MKWLVGGARKSGVGKPLTPQIGKEKKATRATTIFTITACSIHFSSYDITHDYGGLQYLLPVKALPVPLYKLANLFVSLAFQDLQNSPCTRL